MTALRIARSMRAAVCALVGFLGMANGAFAQTYVSGQIASDAHWTEALSPYVVTGDTQIVAGATVTIDPGVQVYVVDGSNVIVSEGAIRALGNDDAPILFSSKRVLDGQSATRGSWGQIQFLDGTIDAETRLEHVAVEYGHGIRFSAASAVLNHVTLRHNAGAAVALDLASSPVGVGNRATDNEIDAITLPSGEVQGDVTWGLRGIQYLVASGIIEVGAPPHLQSVVPNSGQVDESVEVVLSGTRLAGLTDITFDKPGITAVQSAPATGDTVSVQFVVAPDAEVGPVALMATTDAGEVRVEDAFLIQPPQPKLLAITPSQIFVGQGESTLEVTAESLQSGTEVMLDGTPLATAITSPEHATAVVPSQAMAGTKQVSLQTPDPSSPGEFFTSTSLPLQILSPPLALEPAVSNAQVGQSVTLTATLPYPAPAGGLVLSLSSSSAAIASVVSSAAVPAGASEVEVTVSAKALGTATIRATSAGYEAATATVRVTLPPALSVSPSVMDVAVDATLPVEVKLDPAPTQDTVIDLSSSDAAIFTVPAQITALAGATATQVDVTGISNGQATLNAMAAGYNAGSGTVRVSPKAILMPTSAVVAPGATRSLTVALNAPAPAGGLTLSLTSSNPAVLSVPSSVTVAEGQTSAVIDGISGVAQGTASLTATAGGFQSGATQFTVRTVSIYLTVKSGVPVNLSTPVTVTLSEPAPAGGISVDLVVSDPLLASLSQSRVDIPAGSRTSSFAAPRLNSLATGTVTVTASAPGLTSGSRSVTLVAPAGVKVYYGYESGTATPAVGRSLILRNGIYVKLGYAQDTPITVTLSSSDPDKVQVPTSVVVPAGSTSVAFDVTGLQLTDSPATITASAPGYDGTNTPLAIDVLQPVPEIQYQETQRLVGSGRDELYIRLGVDRATNYHGIQIATAPVSVVMSLASESPLGIVEGFYESTVATTPKSEYVIPAEGSFILSYVGSPTTAGSYSIKAEIPGGGSTLGLTTLVAKPKLSFSKISEKAVRGFKLSTWELRINREFIGGSTSSPLTVYLSSSDPGKVTVPASVTITSGSSGARFELIGVANTEAGSPVLIDASATNYESPAEKLSVEIIDPIFQLDEWTSRKLVVGQQREHFTLEASNGTVSVSSLSDLPVSLAIVDANPGNVIDGLYASFSGTTPVESTLRAGSSLISGYFGVPTAAGSFRIEWQPSGYPPGSEIITVAPGQLKFDPYYIQNPPVIGKSLAFTSSCVLLTNDSGQTAYTSIPVTVALTSSAPDKLAVPAEVTIPADQYRACFKAVGLAETNGNMVTVDASATGYLSPATKLAASVVPVEWQFWTDRKCSGYSTCGPYLYYMRSPIYTAELNGAVVLSPFINGVLSSQTWGLADASLPLSFADMTPSDIVDGFLATDRTSPTTTVLLSGTSPSRFYVGRASQPGSYAIQTQMPDGAIVTSSAVAVDQDVLTIEPTSGGSVGFENADLGTDTKLSLRVRRKSNNEIGDVISLACANGAACAAPPTVTTTYNYYGSSANFEVTGLEEGDTVLSATLPGVTPAQVSVSVSKPIVKVNFLPSTIPVGSSKTFSLVLRSASDRPLVTTVERTVTLTLDVEGVVTAPQTVTIPIGWDGVNFTVNAVGPGTVIITASEPHSVPSSGSITVN